eukprot:1812787-Lingulodinium_polyedra.AAC.1
MQYKYYYARPRSRPASIPCAERGGLRRFCSMAGSGISARHYERFVIFDDIASCWQCVGGPNQ